MANAAPSSGKAVDVACAYLDVQTINQYRLSAASLVDATTGPSLERPN